MKRQPKIAVGILDRQSGITGRLNGDFYGDGGNGFGPASGPFSAEPTADGIALADRTGREICRCRRIHLKPGEGSTFTLRHVAVGKRFHWEKAEDQTFQGDLILEERPDGTLSAVNEILLEDYLTSVVSSEMNGAAPKEFLKAHAILSRSWLLAGLHKKKGNGEAHPSTAKIQENEDEVIRWYDREEHDLFDVCADDHCQRYQGMAKGLSGKAGEAVGETCGKVITFQGEICDARYSKACGGLTEDFSTAWGDVRVPYLRGISDAPFPHPPIRTEEDAFRWVLSSPDAYCRTEDGDLLEKILPELDRGTRDFFRWTIAYPREELEEILQRKSGLDFGRLLEITPLDRGPSGRISRLEIVGSRRSAVVGKELEIRRWLSRSHLYSSAFVVAREYGPRGEADRFILHGAGWGHGVGLCQIGAAVMASRGFSAGEILGHYFPGTRIDKVY